VKRADLIRHLERHGCEFLREGGNHTVYVNRAARKSSSVPRHLEINEFLARKICRTRSSFASRSKSPRRLGRLRASCCCIARTSTPLPLVWPMPIESYHKPYHRSSLLSPLRKPRHQRAVQEAVHRARLAKLASCHLCYPLARDGATDIRTLQELLGH